MEFTLNVSPLSIQHGNRLGLINGRPMMFKDARAKKYQEVVRLMARQHCPSTPLTGPLVVDFAFILPRPQKLRRNADPDGLIPCPSRPDRDNLQKGTQDALSDFWNDDAQIFDGRTTKFYAEKNGAPRIIVTIKQWSNE